LFRYLATIAPGKQLAWDCATGNGQAAVALAEINCLAEDRCGGESLLFRGCGRLLASGACPGRKVEDLPFPFPEIQAPPFEMVAEWNADDLIGYLRTWSATQRFIAERKHDPLEVFEEEVRSEWDDSARRVVWPLAVRVGRCS
jgi:hypothetical protein